MRQERAANAEDQLSGAAKSAIPPERGPSESQSDMGSTRDRFIGDLQALVGHAQELMQLTSTFSGESIAHARDQLRQSLDTAGNTIKRLQSDAMERGREMAQRTDSYVHENPWQAIAVGAVAGVVLGLAASSLMRSTTPPTSKRHH